MSTWVKLARAAKRAKERDESDTPWYKTPAALAGLGALAAGGAGYGLSRRVRIDPNNKTLAALQRAGSEHGVHRIVDVTRRPLGTDQSVMERLRRLLRPTADENGKLNNLNRLKLWLLEGGDAVPVVAHKGKAWRVTPEGRTREPLNVKGVVHNRHMDLAGSKGNTPADFVRGGVDAEGPQAVRDALTRLGVEGKGVESALLEKHAPGAMAETIRKFPRLSGDPLSDIQRLRAHLEKKFNGVDFMLKPTTGANSGGSFLRGADDWEGAYKRYMEHLDDPAKFKALEKALQESETAHGAYLRKNNLMQGYALDQALENPKGIIAQRIIPEIDSEWRVHVNAGAAPTEMMSVRHLSGLKQKLRDLSGSELGDVQKFVEQTFSKLPEDMRAGIYGLDVVGHRAPDGARQYKIIEMNPSTSAVPKERVVAGKRLKPTGGSQSGFLRSEQNPGIGHHHSRLLSGRHTVPMSLRNAGVAAALGGGAAYGGAKLLRDGDKEA